MALTCISVTVQAQKIDMKATTVPGSKPGVRSLSIESAVETALRNSKSLSMAADAVDKARGRVGESKTGFKPTAGATATLTHLDEGSTITFPDGNGNAQTIPIVRQDQKQVNLQLNLPIDITGLIRTAVQVSEFQEIAARLDYNKTRNQIVLDVKNAYYDVLRAKAYVAVVEQALKNSKERQKTAEIFLKEGAGTKFDVLHAQTEVANAEQNRITAMNRVNLANAVLANTINLDQNTQIETSPAIEKSEVKDFDSAVSEAYGKRPELLQSDAYIRAAEKGVVLARRSVLPTFGVGAQMQYTPDAGGFAPKTTSWAAVATVQIPIYDQGLSRERKKQAVADVHSARTSKAVAQDGIALEVRQAYLAVTEAKDRLKVTGSALEQAKEQYRLAQVRYDNGVTAVPGNSPLLEISDAQSALTQAQINDVNANYDLQNSLARLDRALGRYAYDKSPSNAAPGLPAPAAGGKK